MLPSAVQIANRTATSSPLPTHLVYRHFLHWVKELDEKAQAGGTAESHQFAEPFAANAGLANKQVDLLLAEAKALNADLKKQDQKASVVIAAFRAQAKEALWQGQPIPPPPPQIVELQQERDTLIKSHISILRAALGPETSAKLDQYLASEIAPHVSLKPIAIPRSGRIWDAAAPAK